jgi:large subunit ribosomal protein L25
MLALQAKLRDISRQSLDQLRADGNLPAEVYGHKFENKHIHVSRKDFLAAFKEVGETGLISLQIDGTMCPVLVHHITTDALGDIITSIDFYAVNMKEKTTAEIPVHFIGESPAVKELGGVLVKALEKIEVEALPADLPAHFDIDISALKEFGDSIHVKQIVIPRGVELLTDPETVLVVVNEQRVEVEEAPVVAASETTGTEQTNESPVTTEEKK